MSLSLSKVHEYKRVNDGSQAILTGLNPVTRLGRGIEGEDRIYVFIQGGQFYSEDGKEFKPKDLPPWLNDEIAKMTPAARKEVGLIDWAPPEPDDDD